MGIFSSSWPQLQMTLAVSPGWADGRLSKNNF